MQREVSLRYGKTHSLGNVSFQLTMASRFDLSVKIMAFSVFCTAVVYAVNSGCAVLLERTMVEMRRVELLTPCLQGRCSPN